MADAAVFEAQEDTGVHRRRREDLYDLAERLLERADRRLGSEPPPPRSDPPTSDDLALAETLDLEPDPESQRASMH